MQARYVEQFEKTCSSNAEEDSERTVGNANRSRRVCVPRRACSARLPLDHTSPPGVSAARACHYPYVPAPPRGMAPPDPPRPRCPSQPHC